MDVYKPKLDEEAFRSLSDPDSRAFVIAMVTSVRGTIEGFLSYPRTAMHEEAIEQLHMLKQALEKCGITGLKNYIDDAAKLGKDPGSRQDWTAVKRGLTHAEEAFRRIDSEGHSAGAKLRAQPEASKASQTSDQLLAAVKATPLQASGQTVNSHYIEALTAYLKTLPFNQLHQLRGFCAGKLRQQPEVFTQMFGTGLGNLHMQTLKSVLNACIVPDTQQGLSVCTDINGIQESVRNSQGRLIGM